MIAQLLPNKVMKKTHSVLESWCWDSRTRIGIFAVALAFLLGCSDGSSNSGEPNFTGSNAENFQVYMEDDCPGNCTFSPFSGNGVIRIGIYEYDTNYDKDFKKFLPFGTVKKGRGTLDFSVTTLEADDFPSSISVSPKNAKVFIADELYLISGNKAYRLEQYYESQKYESIIYAYATQEATVKGSFTERGSTVEFDLSMNQGWNAIYSSAMYYSATKSSIKMSTDPGTVNLSSMKWYASYRGSASYYGGPDEASIDTSAGNYCDFGNQCFSIQELNEIYGYAVSCEDAFGGMGTTVHSCPETIDGYCIIEGSCFKNSNDRECNHWDGNFSITKPSG
jgi:hypothetical protein